MSDGEQRYAYARQSGIKSLWTDGTEQHNDRLGRAAELWLAHEYGLPEPRLIGVDPGWEWKLSLAGYRDLTINCRWSSRAALMLPVAKAHKARADVYALVTGDESQMRLRGWAWRHVLLAAAVVNPGKADCHLLKLDQLHPAASFAALLATYGHVREVAL